MLSNRRTFVSTLATLAGGQALAQTPPFPSKVIRIVPFGTGGGPIDTLARVYAEKLQQRWGQPVIVDAKPGASGIIAADFVAKSAPDGYTLLLNHIGMSTMPALYRKLSFSVPNDFEYLGMVNDVPMTLIARPNIPANNMKELTGWIAQNKGKINLGNAGLGAASHLCGLMFQNAMQVEMTTVPYKGTAPAITDLIGGQIDLLCDQTTNTTSQIEGKKVKAFAVTTSKRLTTPALKDLPTLAESGLKNFEVTIWHGLYAPKGTPAAIVTKINDALKLALKDPEFIKKQEGLGAVVVTDKRIEPAEHKKFVQAEIDKWGAVIKAAGTYAD